jgi:hypothetical protein
MLEIYWVFLNDVQTLVETLREESAMDYNSSD